MADYIDVEWAEWLQTHRVELNAMSTPRFLAWLDAKIATYSGKLVPPKPVLAKRLVLSARTLIHQKLTAEALRKAKVDAQTARELRRLRPKLSALDGQLTDEVLRRFDENSAAAWTEPVDRVAADMVKDIAN